MKLSKHNIKTFLLSANQKIEENADFISDKLYKGDEMDFITYPPNCGFTEEENRSLEKLKNDPNLKSALRKILADNSAGVLFDLFNIIDGTSEPDESFGKWTEICFVDKTDELAEDLDFFHDELYDKYWDWRKIRPKKGWKLDNYDG
ncbi:hypothetical protein [Aquimarina sediminis]|uniref:hypothetical protein n=1 Tax=Aquimarina sediminis TaxID=2070536 RepID=UPI000CA07CE5|nr:hypothetical protein [Aquimarina sediminis]